jgi:hypothetical protein
MKKNEKLKFHIKKRIIASLNPDNAKRIKGGQFIACTEMETFCPCTKAL